jgi:RNA recognition motif-containing protein
VIEVPQKGITATKPTQETDDLDYSKVYATNFPFEADENEISEALETCGDVVNVQVPLNRETGQRRGFAFIEFATKAAAVAAIAKSGQIVIHGRRIYVQEIKPQSPSTAVVTKNPHARGTR